MDIIESIKTCNYVAALSFEITDKVVYDLKVSSRIIGSVEPDPYGGFALIVNMMRLIFGS